MINIKKTDINISFNDLSKYSNFPLSLFSSSSLKFKRKTKDEVIREFELEKWQFIYDKIKKMNNISLEDVESIYQNLNEKTAYYYDNQFFLSNNRNVIKYHLELYSHFLSPYIKNSSALVELGAGYGSKIIGLSKLKRFSKIPLYAFELSEKGCDIMNLISKSINLELNTGSFDYASLDIDSNIIPQGSVIFTSYSLHYAQELSLKFIDYINKLKPKAVIHFEPVYELFSDKTIHNVICRKYFEINDYTKNIMSVILSAEKKNKINIKLIKPNILGSNPFLPISVIIWEPKTF